MKLRPVHIDGILYISIAALVFLQGVFSGEEAYKYVNPWLLFWLKTIVGCMAAAAGAAKMFRSGAVANDRKQNGNGKEIQIKP